MITITGDAERCCLNPVILSAFIGWNFLFCKNGGEGGSRKVFGFSQILTQRKDGKTLSQELKQTYPKPNR